MISEIMIPMGHKLWGSPTDILEPKKAHLRQKFFL